MTMPTVDQLSFHVQAHSLAKCGQISMKTAPIRLQRQPNEQKKYTKTSRWRRKVWRCPFVATSADVRQTPFILQDLTTAKISTGVFTASKLQFKKQNSRQDDSTQGCSTVGSMFEPTRDLNRVGFKWGYRSAFRDDHPSKGKSSVGCKMYGQL